MSKYKQHKLYRPLKKCLMIATIRNDDNKAVIEIENNPFLIIHNDLKNRYVEVCNGDLYLYFKKYFKCNQSMNLFIRTIVEDRFRVNLDKFIK